MRKYTGLGLYITVFVLVLFAGLSQHSALSTCISRLEPEQYVMHAADPLSSSIPAVRETKGRSETRLFIEECLFFIAVRAVLPLNQKQNLCHLTDGYHWQFLSKYLAAIIFRQTVR